MTKTVVEPAFGVAFRMIGCLVDDVAVASVWTVENGVRGDLIVVDKSSGVGFQKSSCGMSTRFGGTTSRLIPKTARASVPLWTEKYPVRVSASTTVHPG
jgi:hypothetical protein